MSLKYKLQKLPFMPQRISQRIAQQGVIGTLDWVRYSMAWRLKERRLGIDTREHAFGLDVYGSNGGQGYEPIDYHLCESILDYLQPDAQRDVFFDYGAGLGRVVIAAAMRSFRRVVGIEIDPELFEYAQQHIQRVKAKGKLHCDIELVHADAAHYDLPEDVTCILMYNAFLGQLTFDVLDRIRKSLDASPRRIRIVYVPLKNHGNQLAQVSWLTLQDELPTKYWNHVDVYVYEAQPPQSQSHQSRTAATAQA